MFPDFTKLADVLVWLTGAGVAAWALIVSDAFRNWREDGYLTKFSPLGLQAAVTGATLIVPILAYAILALVPAEGIAAVEPYYKLIALLFTAIVGQKIWFRTNK